MIVSNHDLQWSPELRIETNWISVHVIHAVVSATDFRSIERKVWKIQTWVFQAFLSLLHKKSSYQGG